MGIKSTEYVLFDEVISFLRKNLEKITVEHQNDFFQALGYDNPETALKDFVFDYVWKLPNDEQISKLETALEYLIDDSFTNYIIHCSPNPNKHYLTLFLFSKSPF